MNPAIDIRNLKRYFGDVKAVDDISLTVGRGELFGFLGPNGAGKTTTIRCMMDLLRPNQGSITLLGSNAQSDSVGLKRKIGYVPSDSHCDDRWTGREHINFVAKLRGVPIDQSTLVEQLGVEIDTKVKNLSMGNKQKLALLLGFLGKPELIILDEPTRGLDPVFQRTVDMLMQEFCKQGGTVFLSSHNLSEVEHLCSRVGIIRSGKLAAVETLEDLRKKAVHVVSVDFAQPVDVATFRLPNVEIVRTNHTGFHARVTGDLSPFLAVLGKHSVKDLEITHASLEEVFLRFYER